VRLSEFKSRQLAKLFELKQKLLSAYPDRTERIEYIADLIATKAYSLRSYSLPDYIFTLHLASKEFKEFAELIPSAQEIEELFEAGEPQD